MLEVGADLGDITVKSDQELALMALVRVIGAHQAAGDGGRVLVDPSPVGDSRGNGVVERAITLVQVQIRNGVVRSGPRTVVMWIGGCAWVTTIKSQLIKLRCRAYVVHRTWATLCA